MRALLKDIEQVLANGGLVRFHWHNCHVELINTAGQSQTVDGRTYQAFTNRHQGNLIRTEMGTTDGKDLVIEWRIHASNKG